MINGDLVMFFNGQTVFFLRLRLRQLCSVGWETFYKFSLICIGATELVYTDDTSMKIFPTPYTPNNKRWRQTVAQQPILPNSSTSCFFLYAPERGCRSLQTTTTTTTTTVGAKETAARCHVDMDPIPKWRRGRVIIGTQVGSLPLPRFWKQSL